MKRKSRLRIIICSIFAVCAVPLICIGCGQKHEETKFGDWVLTAAPTCEAEGVETRVSLDDPTVIETRAVSAIGHDWNEWETETEPTCLAAGVETRTCNTCENSDWRAIPATGHSWDEWITVSEATCTVTGSQMRTCLNDDKHTEYRKVDALGHDYSEWVITRAPTCTVPGVEARYCRNCNDHTDVRSVDALGHNWGSLVVVKAATCTEGGERVSVCVNDSSHVRTFPDSAKGHAFGEWVVSIPATESEDGEEMRVCQNDASHIETRVLPAMGSDGLRFGLNADGTAYSIRSSDRYMLRETVYVPAVHNGLPVTELGSCAFGMQNSTTENIVFLGNNIKTINGIVFRNLSKLQSIALPEGIEEISPTAVFIDCASLKSITIPASLVFFGRLTTGNPIFKNCPSIETITVDENNPVYKSENNCVIERATNKLIAGTSNSVIPDYVTSIGKYAFMDMSITSLRIPSSVETIEKYAFYRCGNLVNVSIEGNNLKSIGACAFSGCSALETFNVPASVVSISNTAFSGLNFAAIEIAEENPVYFKETGCIIDRSTNTVITGSDNSVIPDYITEIGQNAFRGCRFESLVIPPSVKIINEDAFYKCKIDSLEIPVGVEKVYMDAFCGWTEEQTIIVKGFSSEEEAETAWGRYWRLNCDAVIVYQG